MAARQKLLLVSARWDHLGGHSGLAPLGEQLGAHFDVQRVVPSLGDKLRVGARLVMGILRERLLGVPKKQGWSPFYNRHGLLLETAALRMLRAQHFDVVFFEALEDHFDAFAYAGQRLSGTRIVGVSHQPPAWWRMYGVNGNVFAGVDLVIALSRAGAELSAGTDRARECAFRAARRGCRFFRPRRVALTAPRRAD